MLWDMTHGPRPTPGGTCLWSMPSLVRPGMNSGNRQTLLAYQYQSDRIEELLKESKGYMDSDAVPTCDVYDFYFRDAEDSNGWYRRIILDWGTGEDISSLLQAGTRPTSRTRSGTKWVPLHQRETQICQRGFRNLPLPVWGLFALCPVPLPCGAGVCMDDVGRVRASEPAPLQIQRGCIRVNDVDF